MNKGQYQLTQGENMLKGWECPKCNAVYAPWYPGCDNCTGEASSTQRPEIREPGMVQVDELMKSAQGLFAAFIDNFSEIPKPSKN
jgi:hypothetical protein